MSKILGSACHAPSVFLGGQQRPLPGLKFSQSLTRPRWGGKRGSEPLTYACRTNFLRLIYSRPCVPLLNSLILCRTAASSLITHPRAKG